MSKTGAPETGAMPTRWITRLSAAAHRSRAWMAAHSHDLAGRVRALGEAERRSRPSGWTWVITCFALAAMMTTASIRTGTTVSPGTGLIALILAAWLPLVFRTLRPTLVLACVVVVEVCILAFLAVPDNLAQDTAGMGAYQPVPLASMLAVYSVAARTPRRVGWIAGCAAGAVLMVAGFLAHGQITALTDLVVFYVVVTAAALGTWVANRRDARARLVRTRAREMSDAVAGERLRIARELHDVLAHNLTLVNAQAGVAAYLLQTQPQAAAEALHDITRHTSRAIDELRATIGLLREGDGDLDDGLGAPMRPVPGIGALDELIESHRSTGAQITLTATGSSGALDQHADLAAYRIVQEALTNTSKHAPGMPVEVMLAWSAPGVRIRVVNSAVPAGVRRILPPGTGHGLIGMRERALAARGELRAGRLPDGRFEVVAILPAWRDTGQTAPSDAASPDALAVPEPRKTGHTHEGTPS